ncbi:type II toxin-antitoxin system MqsA family antitoxin [Oceanimonas smirnovii]|uniref:type II toxin-antitoxin system MqsA family antitoxin n=1 Tax=Oceanimonas smirnovii TaxID=264574 RepID=UPI000370568C|nr:type II toxin-antitoxin system MqsA family antitoxin [Oceanimonas smirnovii]
MAAKLCPICESGNLHPHSEMVEVEFMGHKAMRPSLYSVCDACGSEQATAADLRHNKRDTIAFRKTVMKLLTGAEVKALRKQWGLTQEEAARVFGGGPVAFAKYEVNDVVQSESMDKLLRVAQAFPEVLSKLKKDAGVQDIKPERDLIGVGIIAHAAFKEILKDITNSLDNNEDDEQWNHTQSDVYKLDDYRPKKEEVKNILNYQQEAGYA